MSFQMRSMALALTLAGLGAVAADAQETRTTVRQEVRQDARPRRILRRQFDRPVAGNTRTTIQVQPGQPGQVQVQPGQQQPGQQYAQQQQGPARSDLELAQMLIDCDDAEVAVSKLATQKSRNDDVKQFADELVKAHSAARDQLAEFAGLERGEHVYQANSPANQASQDQANQQNPRQPQQQAETRDANQGLDFLAVSEELRDACVATARREMDKKEGHELDACFVGMQIAGHVKSLEQVKILKNHASAPELQTILASRQKAIEDHLQHAKDLMEKIAKKSDSSATN